MKESCSTRKSNGTPMKFLINEEMLKEIESKRREPNIVARLMGLDNDFPSQLSIPTSCNSGSRESLLHSVLAYVPEDSQHKTKDGHSNKIMPYGYERQEKIKFKDIYEIRPQPPKGSVTDYQFVRRANGMRGQDERMALIRRKIIDANYLSRNENALQAKKFDDSIRILSSNRDFGIKFFKEPNPLFTKSRTEFHKMLPTSETTRITVLQPLKTAESERERIRRKKKYGMIGNRRFETNMRHWGSNYPRIKSEDFSEPTKIVVLMPNTRKSQSTETELPSMNNFAKLDQLSDFDDSSEDSEELASTSLANMIDHELKMTSSYHRKNKVMIPWVNSDRYDREVNSFGSSENKHIHGDDNSAADPEDVIPTFRGPCDFDNNYGSHHSFFACRDSYSLEASVVREAKRHLSERWALGEANEVNQEEMCLPRRSRTLGEMLACSSVKKEDVNCEHGFSHRMSCGNENEASVPKSFFTDGNKDTGGETSAANLMRSNSVPISSKAYDNIVLKLETPDNRISNTNLSIKVSNAKKGESLKSKVSNFFYPKRRKAGREKLDSPKLPSFGAETHSTPIVSSVSKNEQQMNLFCVNHQVEHPSVILEGPTSATTDTSTEDKTAEKTNKCNSSDMDFTRACESTNTNQDKSSSYLVSDSPVYFRNPHQSVDIGLHLLSRISPMSSVCQTSSQDDDHVISSPLPLKLSTVSPGIDNEIEPNVCIQKLLLDAGFEESSTVLNDRHSLDSPLDPILLEKFLDTKEDEANYKEKTSRRRLLFDSVNSSRDASLHSDKTCFEPQEDLRIGFTAQLTDCLAQNNMLVAEGSEDIFEAIARTLRTGIGGMEWTESMRLEVDEIGTEMSNLLLINLVCETLTELIAACACC